MDRFDAAVIGGGPAGATAAALLATNGWSVALIEGKKFPRRKVCGEYLSATNWPMLQELGVAGIFGDLAGPAVNRTAVFVGNASASADLPRHADCGGLWGRALGREHLDTLLLKNAARQGVDVRQPCRCTELRPDGKGFACRLESLSPRRTAEIHASTVIAAHGSWDMGKLGTQRHHESSWPGDWMAFKAHFRETNLPAGLMPLLSFPDGYGGMVHCDGGRVSLSCCIRRGRLEQLGRSPGQSAGEVVLQHILDASPILRPVFHGALLDEPWLSAGPIQPGLRACYLDGVFVVGNAAGEAHPVVAEGISMALQSAWLLTKLLIPQRAKLTTPEVRAQVGAAYATAWKRSFVPRIRTAAAVAQWAMRPKLVAATLPLLRGYPSLLTFGARLSGKCQIVTADNLNRRRLRRGGATWAGEGGPASASRRTPKTAQIEPDPGDSETGSSQNLSCSQNLKDPQLEQRGIL